jgi:symplekin
MRKLLEYTLSTHISSVNLITSICVLSNIAKQRPEYMAIVLNTYSKLLQNMPPTLGNSQVSTVRKQIKLQIISICKNPSCGEHVNDITKILTDLGTSSNEISKILPKTNNNESRKRQLSSFSLDSNDTKKSKTNISSLTSKLSNEASLSTIQQSKSLDSVNLEKIIDDIVVKLSVKENVTDLVMVSMAYLPEQMPKTFVNSFKPISAAGTNLQIRSLARMLALQLNEAKLISVDSSTKNSVVTIDEDIYDEDNDENEDIDKPISLPSEKKDQFELNESSSSKKSKPQQISTKTLQIKPLNSILPSKKASNKAYKLNDVTLIAANQFNTQSLEELLFKTYSRILSCEGLNH